MELVLTDEFGNALGGEATAGMRVVGAVRDEDGDDSDAATDEIGLSLPFHFSNDVARTAEAIFYIILYYIIFIYIR